MNTTGNLPVSEKTALRVRKTKSDGAARKTRGRPRSQPKAAAPVPPAVGTLARTKTLLLAALRVWELKQRVSE